MRFGIRTFTNYLENGFPPDFILWNIIFCFADNHLSRKNDFCVLTRIFVIRIYFQFDLSKSLWTPNVFWPACDFWNNNKKARIFTAYGISYTVWSPPYPRTNKAFDTDPNPAPGIPPPTGCLFVCTHPSSLAELSRLRVAALFPLRGAGREGRVVWRRGTNGGVWHGKW